MGLAENVEKFADAFSAYVSEIEAVAIGGYDQRYRKILYFTVLEGLAAARYRRGKSPSEALGSFVVNECGWIDGDRVSLPHIVAAMERTRAPEFTRLREAMYAKYASWGSRGPVYRDSDPTKADVQALRPAEASGPLKVPETGTMWMKLQHRALLYAYRNKLSHEAREQTLSFGDSFGNDPHYNSTQLGDDPIEWHLSFPAAFLAALCLRGIEALKAHCYSKLQDPYASFGFGHYLVDEFNDVAAHPILYPAPTQEL